MINNQVKGGTKKHHPNGGRENGRRNGGYYRIPIQGGMTNNN